MASSSNQHEHNLYPSMAMPTAVPAVQNYLFLGNPGTGKSTLINCLVGGAIFDSGVSYGEGMTKRFQKRIHETVQYMDTPGLADRQIQEAAVAAITEALRQDGTYKLFFMVRLESGRVVSDDLATIEIVLNSIELKDVPFTVIVNNVKKRQYASMMEKGPDFMKVVTVINSIKHTTPYIVFIPVLSALDEEDNAVTELPGDVESFIRFDAPTVDIAPEAVKPIKIEDFKKISEALREKQEQMLQDNAILERRVAELMNKSSAFHDIFGKMGGFFSSIAAHFMPPNDPQMRASSQHGRAHIRGGRPASNSQYAMEDTMATHYQYSGYPARAPTDLAFAQPQQVCDAYNPNQADQRADHQGMIQAARTSETSKVQQENQQPGVLANQGMGYAGSGEAGVSVVAQQIHLLEDHAKAGARIHGLNQRSKEVLQSSGISASSQVPSALASKATTSSETPETNSPTLKHEGAMNGQPKDATVGRVASP